jgi:hypothetical protein
MGVRSLNLVFLLAVAVAVSPLRAVVPHHVDQHVHAEHGHTHVHTHGDHSHAHEHHHHADREHTDRHDHHGVIDHLPDSPKLTWTGPRRTKIHATPTLPPPSAAPLSHDSDWQPILRVKPPPWSEPAPQHLNSIRTIILRL